MCRSLQIIWTQSLLSAKLYFQRPVQEERAHKVEAVIDELDPSSAKNLDHQAAFHSVNFSQNLRPLLFRRIKFWTLCLRSKGSGHCWQKCWLLLLKFRLFQHNKQCVSKSKSLKTNRERNQNDKIQQAMRMTSYQGTNKSCHWKSMGTRLLRYPVRGLVEH